MSGPTSLPSEEKVTTSPVNLLTEAFLEMDHARMFIRTREKMHPDGVHQFDKIWAKVRRFLEQQ